MRSSSLFFTLVLMVVSANVVCAQLVTVSGSVTSFDTPGVAVSGISVFLSDLDGNAIGNATTDVNGFYSIGNDDIETGIYDLYLSYDPVGSNGYHDAVYNSIEIGNDGIVNFGLYEILAPASVTAFADQSIATISWGLPANNLQATGGNLDQLNDLQGFIVTNENGEVVGTTDANTFELTLDGVSACDELAYSVAADYGYDEEYRIYSDEEELLPFALNYQIEEVDYQWLEVRDNPDATALNLDENNSQWLDFPSEFLFYNNIYHGIKVSLYGAMSFDPEAEIGFIPSSIPNTESPLALIAPLWGEFQPAGNNNDCIYYIFDDHGDLWIEWKLYCGGFDGHAIFQTKLEFSSGNILFQYHTLPESDFAAVSGVQDISGYLGTMLRNVNTNETSYLLTYEPVYPGIIYGVVRDCDGNAVEGAYVIVQGDTIDVSNFNGHYRGEVNSGFQTINYISPDFFPYSQTIFADPCEMTFVPYTALAYAEGEVSPASLEMCIIITEEDPVYTGSDVLDFENVCNSPIEWQGDFEILNVPDHWELGKANNGSNSTDDLWDLIEAWTLDEPSDPAGVVITNDRIYVSEFEGDGNDNFYEYDYAGILIRSEQLPTELQGIKDMAWDSEWLYAVSYFNGGTLYMFNPDDLSDYQMLGFAPGLGEGIALDYSTGDLFTSSQNGLGKFENIAGVYNYVEMTMPTGIEDCKGIAWMPADPEGMNLWMINSVDNNTVIYRVDPQTLDIDSGYEIYPSDIATGIDIFNGYDQYTWNIATIVESSPVRVDIWEGYEAGVPWLFLEPEEGILEPGDSQELVVSYNVEGHDLLEYVTPMDEIEARVVITGQYMRTIEIPILIYFLWSNPGTSAANNQGLLLPEKYALHQNYPNPFNPETAIKFDLVEAQNVKLSVYNILGQQVAEIINQRMDGGYHSVNFDASLLSSGIYFYRLETETFSDMKKMVMVR